jgi:hypothetical protein
MNPKSRKTPWVIGAFGIAIFLVATWLNYADTWFPHHTATDISANSPSKGE